MAEAFQSISGKKDITHFLDKTNGLHDAYLIGVRYIHNGHTAGNPHVIDPALSELCIRYMVTSIQDAIVEMVFSSLLEWQIKDTSFDITDTSISILEDGTVIWSDDCSTAPEDKECGSYVIARTMKWRFVEA